MRQFCTDFSRETYGFPDWQKTADHRRLSNRSIAYGIAKACHAQGAELAFSYVGERFKDRITEFAADFGSKLIFDCDVGSDEQIAAVQGPVASLAQVRRLCARIGFAPREAIAGDFLDGLSREGFRIAHDISAYSFPGMAKAALPYLNDKSRPADADLPGRGAHHPQLQHHGPGQGQPGSLGALPGRIHGPQGHSRQRHQRRPHQDAGRQRHQGFRQAAGHGGRPRRCAAT
jgi:NAD(P)-dependent dehydrogenase (short-subunit alcohol dehydrogenase family)